MKNKKGQEFSIVGVVGGVIGGMASILITNSMGGGLFLKLIGAVITGVVCYFVSSKIIGE